MGGDGDDDDDVELGEDTGVSKASGDEDRPEVNRVTHDTSGRAGLNPLKRRPGKQPGAQGFGRQQKIPVTAYEDHYPPSCACCGQGLETETPNSRACTGFETLDIEFAIRRSNAVVGFIEVIFIVKFLQNFTKFMV